jgi:hypothetical protein
LIKAATFRLWSKGRKPPFYGDETFFRNYPANFSYGFVMHYPVLSKKNIFDLECSSGINQIAHFDSVKNAWNISIMWTNGYSKIPENPRNLSTEEKIRHLDHRSRFEFVWKNGVPWWTSCTGFSGGNEWIIFELVTPEWEKKYGKVEKL